MKSLVTLSIIMFCCIATTVGMEYKPTKKYEEPHIVITSITNESNHAVRFFDNTTKKEILTIEPKKTIKNVIIPFTKKGNKFKKSIDLVNETFKDNLIKFKSTINPAKNKLEYSVEPQYGYIKPSSVPIQTLALSNNNTYVMTIQIKNGQNENEIKALINLTPS